MAYLYAHMCPYSGSSTRVPSCLQHLFCLLKGATKVAKIFKDWMGIPKRPSIFAF